jgi:hypothetical protein
VADDEIAILNRDLRKVRAGLRISGVPNKLLDNIGTRALRSGRRQTGTNQSNRASRWRLDPTDPQFGLEADCKMILLRLYGMMLEFTNAPQVDDETKATLEKYLGQPIRPAEYRDALTLERLNYSEFAAEIESPVHGRSRFHLGHEDPKATPKHTPSNVSWREERSNLIQGDLTLPEARTKFVELIARYFELGEVRIEAEE